MISTNQTSSIPACQWLLKRSWIAAQHPNWSWAKTRRQINCCSPKTFHDTGSGCRAFIKASTRCSQWRTRRSRRSWRSCPWWVLLCKAKRQYLLTFKVSRYCLLTLHGGVVVYRLTSILVINSNNAEIFFGRPKSIFQFIWIPMLWVYGHFKYFILRDSLATVPENHSGLNSTLGWYIPDPREHLALCHGST